jgi:hypothetical protein
MKTFAGSKSSDIAQIDYLLNEETDIPDKFDVVHDRASLLPELRAHIKHNNYSICQSKGITGQQES